MNARRIIIGLIVLILIGGITTALYRYLGGIEGQPPENQNDTVQMVPEQVQFVDLRTEGYALVS